MKSTLCSIEVVLDRPFKHRGVAFLIVSDTKVNARKKFYRLKITDQLGFRVAFDYWADGRESAKLYSWRKFESQERYGNSFFFEFQSHRLYGFLCHPENRSQGYRLGVLVAYLSATHFVHEQEILELCENMHLNLEIRRAINERVV
jgi:hypothetical protein